MARSTSSNAHLCFAGDTRVICQATKEDTLALKMTLDSYARVSSQVTNFDKSSITFCKATPDVLKQRNWSNLGVHEGPKHDKYLGMPATTWKSKHENYGLLRERIWKKINGLGKRQLSRAGKEFLMLSAYFALNIGIFILEICEFLT